MKETPRVTVTITHVLDNDFWGIEDMLESGLLTIGNIKELIHEDILILIENGTLNVCIEMIEEKEKSTEGIEDKA